jgi:hypothetical protein
MLAEVAKHIVECSRLGLVWIDAKFVAEYHKADLRSGAIGARFKRDQRLTDSLFVPHPKVQHK